MHLRKHNFRGTNNYLPNKLPRAIVLVVALWFSSGIISAQKGEEELGRMMFYNVENLFDTINDPDTDDDDFTPNGSLHWTKSRYRKKREHIAWVISNIGEWSYPAIVGMVEVEDTRVIHDLLSLHTFEMVDYDYAVTDSSDPRGVDVALMWDNNRLKHISSREIPHYGELQSYPLSHDPRKLEEAKGTGRNTLWVTLEHRATGRLMDIFVLHAPSRRAGTRITGEKRARVLSKIKCIIDELLHDNPQRCVVIMGDFNDNPTDLSLLKTLQAEAIDKETDIQPTCLYNLTYTLYKNGKGTHRFQGRPWMPDQIIVSGNLYQGDQPLLSERQVSIFKHPVLFDKDGNLKRTYRGTVYTGGYSDHLPIYIDLH